MSGKALTAEEIEAAFEEAPKRSLCTVGNIIEENPALGPKIMDVEHYSHDKVSRVLKTLGFSASGDSIRRHRKGDCRCPKEG